MAAREKKAHIFDRDQRDWYVEEARASEALFRTEKFVGDIWDPACGGGNIVESALSEGYFAIGTDVVDRSNGADWFDQTIDFLAENSDGFAPWTFSNIVTNPPFYRAKGTEHFIRRALSIAQGKVAIFTEIGFLAGHARSTGLWEEHPPTRIYSISPRINCPPGEHIASGGKVGGGTADWVWLVWDLTSPRSVTTFHWMRAGK